MCVHTCTCAGAVDTQGGGVVNGSWVDGSVEVEQKKKRIPTGGGDPPTHPLDPPLVCVCRNFLHGFINFLVDLPLRRTCLFRRV